MKEKHCYVALDFDKERMKAPTPPHAQKCLLPDGREVKLGQERFFGPEVLFQTSLIGEPEGRDRGGLRHRQGTRVGEKEVGGREWMLL